MRIGLLACAAGLGGTLLALPPAAAQEACATYIVQAGDTLTRIARRAYGTDSYREIYEANRGVIGPSPERIEVGAQLRLPCPDGSLPGATRAEPEPVTPPAAGLPPPPPPPPGDGRLRFVVTASLPPFTDAARPGYGLLGEVLARVTEVALPDQAFRIEAAPEGLAPGEALRALAAADLGLPWFRPDCAQPVLPLARDLCAGFRFTAPLAELASEVLVRAGAAPPAGGAFPAGSRICLPGGYLGPDPVEAGIARPGAIVAPAPDLAACLEALRAGRADAVLANPDMLTGREPGVERAAALARRHQLVAVARRGDAAAEARLERLNSALRDVLGADPDWPRLVAAEVAAWRAEAVPARP